MATLIGTDVSDTLTGGIDSDLIVGYEGGDSLTGGDGDDTIIGDATYFTSGGVFVSLGTGSVVGDVLIGGDGNDWIFATGTDVVDGGNGNDTVDIDVSQSALAYNINLSATPASAVAGAAFGGIFSNIEVFRFWLGNGNDTFLGSSGDDYISGGAGSDSLDGGNGNDQLYSGAGNDTLRGGAGNDLLAQFSPISIGSFGAFGLSLPTNGVVFFDAGVGDDYVSITQVGSVAVGGDGNDSLEVATSPTFLVNLDLSTGDANSKVGLAYGLTVSGFESFALYGGALNDTISGSSGKTTIFGGSGDDILAGGIEADFLFGQLGSDVLSGGAGSDNLDGGTEDDSLATDGAFTLVMGQRAIGLGSTLTNYDLATSGDGNDWIISTGGDSIDAGAGSDTLDIDLSGSAIVRNLNFTSGTAAALTGALSGTIIGIETIRVWLGSGNDSVLGSSGSDVLSGGAGNDTIDGGDGNDTIYTGANLSGTNSDSILGGLGNDVLIQANPIQIGIGGVLTFGAPTGASNSTLNGGDGNDYISVSLAGTTAAGGNGTADVLALTVTSLYVNAALMSDAILSAATSTTLSGFESYNITFNNSLANQVSGGANNDTLQGGSGGETILGGNGNDLLLGGLGDDSLRGDDGADLLDGGAGNDTLTGSAGADTFSILIDGAGNDVITDFQAGTDVLQVTGTNLTITNNLNLDSDGLFNDARVSRAGGGSLAVYNTSLGTINGTAGNDSLVGSDLPEGMFGLDGNDTLIASGSDDNLNGGNGNDSLVAGAGIDNLTGGAGNDTFVLGTSSSTTIVNDFVLGQDSLVLPDLNGLSVTNNLDLDDDGLFDDVTLTYSGNLAYVYNLSLFITNGTASADTLTGTAATDTLNGLGGNDFLEGLDGGDSISGGDGNDVVEGGNGADSINGGTGNDFLANGASSLISGFSFSLKSDVSASDTSNDTIDGGDGNDVVIVGLGDSADGGIGTDTIYFDFISATNSVTLNLGNGGAVSTFLTNAAISQTDFESQYWWFGNGADNITGTGLADFVSGGSGNDTLVGGVGNDTLAGGLGRDSLDGGDGDDVIGSSHIEASIQARAFVGYETNVDFFVDTLNGGAGNDQIAFALNDIVDGGIGDDTAAIIVVDSLSRTLNFATDINTVLTTLMGGSVTNFEAISIIVTGGNNAITGSSLNDVIVAAGGNDTLVGGDGADSINTGEGTNNVNGGAGNDQIITGNGIDIIAGGSGGDLIFANGGGDFVGGGADNDSIRGDAGQDTLLGEAGIDTIFGGNDNDSIDGGSENDFLFGDDGNDTLFGGLGNDNVNGGAGNDRLAGGDGEDTFAFSAVTGIDTITDFVLGEDALLFQSGGITGFINALDLDGDGQFDDVSILHNSGSEIRILNFTYNPADGTGGSDTMVGTAGADFLQSYAGNDTIYGNGGSDTLLGGTGNDFLNGSLYRGQNTPTFLDAVGDSILGGAGNDNVNGSFGGDTLHGDDGNDFLSGFDASDILFGGSGNDSLSGGDGDDYIASGTGNDFISSSFFQEGTDTIADFNSASDFLSFSGSVETITNGLDLDADGQFDDIQLVHSGGTLKLMNGAFSGTQLGTIGNDNVVVGDVWGVYYGLAGNDTLILDPNITVLNPLFISATRLDGGLGNDSLVGNSLNNTLQGGLGNDTFFGGAGNDGLNDIGGLSYFDGGDGYDFATWFEADVPAGLNVSLLSNPSGTITTSTGTTLVNIESFTLYLGAGNDTISMAGLSRNQDGTGELTNNFTVGGSGNDSMVGSIFSEFIQGDTGNDTIFGLDGDDSLYGALGDDGLFGEAGDDLLYGDAGFTIENQPRVDNEQGGNDTLSGGSGNDTLAGFAGNDSMDGGTGFDRVEYTTSQAAINVSLAILTGQNSGWGVDTILGVEAITGSDYNDTLIGDGTDNILSGGLGTNRLTGSAGRDVFESGFTGLNIVTDYVTGFDRIDLGSNTFSFTLLVDADGDGQFDDTVVRVSGVDRVHLLNVVATDFIGTNSNESLVGGVGIDALYGQFGNDTLGGGGGDDMLDGGLGNDILIGGLGNDALYGGFGNDTILVQGDDLVDGGANNDLADFNAATAAVSINLETTGTAQNFGAFAAVTLRNIENISGSAFNDTIIGDMRANLLTGVNGNDSLIGGNGNDSLDGGNGNDTLGGGFGNDLLTGGAGNDRFDFDFATGNDTITDFVDGVDLLFFPGTTITSITANLDLDADGQNDDSRFIHSFGTITLLNTTYINTKFATLGSDSLTLTAGVDNIDALAGDDTVFGLGSNDTITGGLGNDSLIGGDGSDQLFGQDGVDTLVGNSGDDLYYVQAGDVIVEAIGEGIDTAYVEASYVLGSGVEVERLQMLSETSTTAVTLIGNEFGNTIVAAAGTDNVDGGFGNDTIDGRNGNDSLVGGFGNDSINGWYGNDTLVGGGGFDTLYGDFDNDVYYVDIVDIVFEFFGEGYDTVFSEASYTLGASDIEVLAVANAALTTGVSLGGNSRSNLIIAAAGGDFMDGAIGDDTLYGLGGNDTLQGGSGNDTLVGGLGNDIFYVDNVGDILIEGTSEGTETAFTTVSYTLASVAEIENLVAANAASTVGLALTGNSFNNNILATAGGDTLNGTTGADTLYGFAGADVYYVDSSTDIVVESVSNGSDTIFSAGSYTLAFTTEVEVIAAANAASTLAVTLIANEFNNQVLASAGNDSLGGDAGNDTLYGFGGNDTMEGGSGNDVMIGGIGNDVYYVQSAGDFITEAAGEGADIAFTSATYTLASGAEVETLASSTALGLALTGNGFANNILGGASSDTLDGGTGADTLYGFGGSDVYYVDATGDIVVEATGAGLDTIFSVGSYTLAGTSEVEILAAANAAGTSALTLGGNEFDNQILANAGANTLTGNAGNDTLYGFGGSDTLTGGLGNDVLIGGAGSDVFVLGQAFAGATFDTVTDYVVVDDQINLSLAAFSALSAGALSSTLFTIGTAATTSSHRIIYNSTNGNLLYDADGTGTDVATVFANIGAGLSMAATEFLVV